MHITLFRSGVPAASVSDLVDKYGADEFNSPFRSTVALLSYWRQPDARLPAFASVLEIPLGDAAELHFEYQVPVQRGRGKPSCADLMILSAATSVAVEAKSTEPRYETVESWLSRETDGNRADVLGGWLSLLSRVAHAPVPRKKVEGLPYQLIHRAARRASPTPPTDGLSTMYTAAAQTRRRSTRPIWSSSAQSWARLLFRSACCGPSSSPRLAVRSCSIDGIRGSDT